MSRGPHSYRQRDVTRGIRAALAAGCTVRGLVVDNAGNLHFKLGRPGDLNDGPEPNEWDEPQPEKSD